MNITNEQREILHHTEWRAAGGLYCGGGKDMDELVANGLMESAGRKSFVPDEYFRITGKGRAAMRQEKWHNDPTVESAMGASDTVL